jgi:hypothetical protein
MRTVILAAVAALAVGTAAAQDETRAAGPRPAPERPDARDLADRIAKDLKRLVDVYQRFDQQRAELERSHEARLKALADQRAEVENAVRRGRAQLDRYDTELIRYTRAMETAQDATPARPPTVDEKLDAILKRLDRMEKRLAEVEKATRKGDEKK